MIMEIIGFGRSHAQRFGERMILQPIGIFSHRQGAEKAIRE
ncbi:MAG: hypothetical protein ACC608_06060 [Anaerofustis sp.]